MRPEIKKVFKWKAWFYIQWKELYCIYSNTKL